MTVTSFSTPHLFQFLNRYFFPSNGKQTSVVIRVHQLSWVFILLNRPFSVSGFEVTARTDVHFTSHHHPNQEKPEAAFQLTLCPTIEKDEGSIEEIINSPGKTATLNSINLVSLKNIASDGIHFLNLKWNIYLFSKSGLVFQLTQSKVSDLIREIKEKLQPHQEYADYIASLEAFETEQQDSPQIGVCGRLVYTNTVNVIQKIPKTEDNAVLINRLDRLARHFSEYNLRVCLWLEA